MSEDSIDDNDTIRIESCQLDGEVDDWNDEDGMRQGNLEAQSLVSSVPINNSNGYKVEGARSTADFYSYQLSMRRKERLNACKASLCWVVLVIGFVALLVVAMNYFRSRSGDHIGNGGWGIYRNHNNDKSNTIPFIPLKYSQYPNNGAKVAEIVLLGERNSGTNYMASLVASCFPDVPVHTYLKTWKHWFQHEDDSNFVEIDTLVILSILNPYDWVEGMRLVPRDFPDHMNLAWYEFVTKPWTMKRPRRDEGFGYENSTDRICQYHFKFNEVVPCKLDELKMGKRERAENHRDNDKRNGLIKHYPPIWGTEQFEPPHNQTGASSPCYELKIDGSGTPYESIVDMRRDKLLNHIAVDNWTWIKGFELAHFERMSDSLYVDEFLKRVEKHVGLNATCKNIPVPQWKSKQNTVSKEYIDWITDRVDWDVESLVGYFPLRNNSINI